MLYENVLSPDDLRDLLQDHNVLAEIVTSDGDVLVSNPGLGQMAYLGLEPSSQVLCLERLRTQSVQWRDGTTVTVFVSKARADEMLMRIAAYLVITSLLSFALGAWLLRRAAKRAVQPLTDMAVLSERIAAGETGIRVAPTNPSTPLGRVATLFDEIMDRLETKIVRAEATQQVTREMLDNAAHQLRSPIAAVQATADALLYEERPEVRERLRANLLRESERSGSLVSGLLRLAQIDQDQAQAVQHGHMNLGLICRAAVEHAQALAPDITVEYSIENCVRGIWRIDERAVREIMANLADNACRHAVSRVEIRAERPHDNLAGLRISVRDDGPGVPPDQREKIFDRFVSLGSHHGSGLGLPIARGLAWAMGGAIELCAPPSGLK